MNFRRKDGEMIENYENAKYWRFVYKFWVERRFLDRHHFDDFGGSKWNDSANRQFAYTLIYVNVISIRRNKTRKATKKPPIKSTPAIMSCPPILGDFLGVMLEGSCECFPRIFSGHEVCLDAFDLGSIDISWVLHNSLVYRVFSSRLQHFYLWWLVQTPLHRSA